MDHLTEFIKAAYAGPNAAVFVALNILAVFVHRSAGLSQSWAFGLAAISAGFMGGLGSLITAQSIEGITPALLNATLVGFIVGAASSIVIGYGLAKSIRRLGLRPLTPAPAELEPTGDEHAPPSDDEGGKPQ